MTTTMPIAASKATRTKKRARTRAVLPLMSSSVPVVLLLLACAGCHVAQAISPSRLLASFASQQQQRATVTGRAGSRGRSAAAAFRSAAATGSKMSTPYVSYGGRRGLAGSSSSSRRGIGPPPDNCAFVATGDGGVEEFWGLRDLSRDLSSRRPQDMASNMGVSGLGGIAAGYVAKRFGKFLSFACGFMLVSMKVAEEFGYVAVNWEKIEDDVHSLGESVWGREGKVRLKAEKLAMSWQNELGWNASIAGSFLAGFAYAFKST